MTCFFLRAAGITRPQVESLIGTFRRNAIQIKPRGLHSTFFKGSVLMCPISTFLRIVRLPKNEITIRMVTLFCSLPKLGLDLFEYLHLLANLVCGQINTSIALSFISLRKPNSVHFALDKEDIATLLKTTLDENRISLKPAVFDTIVHNTFLEGFCSNVFREKSENFLTRR